MNVKIWILLLVAMCVPFAFAADVENETTDSVDNATAVSVEQEVKIMDTPHGAEVRLLQLEKSITMAIDNGNKVIDRIESSNVTNVSVDVLESIIVNLTTLKTDVIALGVSDNNTVEKYVEYRHLANDLTKQFREEAHKGIKASDVDKLREEFKQAKEKNAKLKEMAEKIRERVKEFNLEHAEKMLTKMGANDSAILDQIENGNLSKKEIGDLIKTQFKSLDSEKQKKVRDELKEDMARTRVKNAIAIEQFKKIEEKREEIRLKLEEKRAEFEEKRAELNQTREEKRLRVQEKDKSSSDDLNESSSEDSLIEENESEDTEEVESEDVENESDEQGTSANGGGRQ